MSALVTALLSYLGADFLMAVLARLGIVGTRAAVVSQATKHLAPVAARILTRLRQRRNQLEAGSEEHQELDEEIETVTGAWQTSGGFF